MRTLGTLRPLLLPGLLALGSLFAATIVTAGGPADDPGTGSWTLTVGQATPTPEVPLESAPPLPTPIAHPGDASSTGCVDCHSKVDSRQAAIADDWRASIHAKEGVGCADCHGGDPTSDEITVGMAEARGFQGVPGRDETVGVVAPVVLIAIIVLLPLLDRNQEILPRRRPIAIFLALVLLVAMAVLTYYGGQV